MLRQLRSDIRPMYAVASTYIHGELYMDSYINVYIKFSSERFIIVHVFVIAALVICNIYLTQVEILVTCRCCHERLY